MYVYISIYIYIHTCKHACVYIYIYICICIHTYGNAYIHKCIYIYIYRERERARARSGAHGLDDPHLLDLRHRRLLRMVAVSIVNVSFVFCPFDRFPFRGPRYYPCPFERPACPCVNFVQTCPNTNHGILRHFCEHPVCPDPVWKLSS